MANVAQIQITNDAHLRRAVATTLKQWFEKEVILESLCVVEELATQSHDANFGVIAIVNKLASHFRWSTRLKHDVRLSLYKNMLPNVELDADPELELVEYRKTRKAAPRVSDSDTQKSKLMKSQAAGNDDGASEKTDIVVFCQLIYSLRKIMSRGPREQFEIFEEVVKEEIRDLNVGPHVFKWVSHLLIRTTTAVVDVKLTETQMSSLVHAFYNAISEAVGPMEADRILTAAISFTEKIPAAARFSPKNFL